jgi:hypothetical protein
MRLQRLETVGEHGLRMFENRVLRRINNRRPEKTA